MEWSVVATAREKKLNDMNNSITLQGINKRSHSYWHAVTAIPCRSTLLVYRVLNQHHFTSCEFTWSEKALLKNKLVNVSQFMEVVNE